MYSKENERKLFADTTLIEFCGTPFRAREKFIMSNSIEDMLTERLGVKIRGQKGIEDTQWPFNIDRYSLSSFKEQIVNIENEIVGRQPRLGLKLIMDGALASMILTRFYEKAGFISSTDANRLIEHTQLWAENTDLAVLTLINPRASLIRDFGTEFLGPEVHEEILDNKRIFYEVFNSIARSVALNDWPDRPKIYLIDIPGDKFNHDLIFFKNANTVFNFLGLPTTEEWDHVLKNNPELRKKKHTVVSGYTMAGLTSGEIKANLRHWDWSMNPEKRRRVKNIASGILGTLGNNNQGV